MEKRRYEFTLYTYSELSGEAQAKALMDYQKSVMEFDNTYFIEHSLRRLEDIFEVKFCDWEIYRIGCIKNKGYVEIRGDKWFSPHGEDPLHFTGLRLRKFIINNFYDKLTEPKIYTKDWVKKWKSKIHRDRYYTNTGYYADEEIAEPIFDFIEGRGNANNIYDLMEECLLRGLKCMEREIQEELSEEHLEDITDVNNWLYLEDGTFFSAPHGGVEIN